MYRRRRFDAEIIELCVRWYITYRLSYRDLQAMMAERGVVVSHSTILRWVSRYVPEFEKRLATFFVVARYFGRREEAAEDAYYRAAELGRYFQPSPGAK